MATLSMAGQAVSRTRSTAVSQRISLVGNQTTLSSSNSSRESFERSSVKTTKWTKGARTGLHTLLHGIEAAPTQPEIMEEVHRD